MNTPVSFELAKLLKEKEINIPAFYYYENEKLVEPYLENGSSTDVEFRVDLSDLKESFNKWSKRISAPTIAEVVMWLYEKYGIWIRVTPIPYSDNITHWRWEHIPTKYAIRNAGWKKEEDYMSPMEAYEKSIEYCLNKLI